jgi:cysteine desulfurase/selenocysteine lyase
MLYHSPVYTDNINKVNIDKVRNDFSYNVSGNKSTIYFDNAATTLKPESVITAMTKYYRHSCANVHRGLYKSAEEATKLYENARLKVKKFINASSLREIVFTSGATESINLVAHSLGESYFAPGDEIILTEMEHHSNLVPWQIIAERKKLILKFIPFLFDGQLDYSALDRLITDNTRLISVVHISNVFGTINDIEQIIQIGKSRNIPILIDAAQSVAHTRIDVQALQPDFLVFSGHKMYGPTGTGILYAKEQMLEKMVPYQAGGDMISAVWSDRATWNELPYKFEAGTPNIAGFIGLGAAIDYLEHNNFDQLIQHEIVLAEYARDRLWSIPDIELYSPVKNWTNILSFNINGVHPHDAAQFLDSKGIAIRAGHHCAQPVMRKLNVPATLRASFAFYNTFDEVDTFIDSVIQAKEFFSHGI